MGAGGQATCREAAALHGGESPAHQHPTRKGGISAMAKKSSAKGGAKKKGGKKR